ncbi:MAG: hypothetical protein AAFU71_11065 [Cyanobacteria bacterium J06632_22]
MFERFVQAAIITVSLQVILLAHTHYPSTMGAGNGRPTADVVAMIEKIEAVFLNR